MSTVKFNRLDEFVSDEPRVPMYEERVRDKGVLGRAVEPEPERRWIGRRVVNRWHQMWCRHVDRVVGREGRLWLQCSLCGRKTCGTEGTVHPPKRLDKAVVSVEA